jgi:amidase
MQALPQAKPWELDPQVFPMPWRTENCTIPPNQKLRIGVIVDDGVVEPQPPVVRAMDEIIAALKSGGHEGKHVFEANHHHFLPGILTFNQYIVVYWDASTHAHAYDLWEKAILSDGGDMCQKLCHMSGEPLIEGMLVGKPENLLSTTQLHQVG